MKKEDVYLHCLERWSSADKRISYFEENFDEWFSQLPEDIHEVVCQLLEMFEYYSQLKVNQYLCDLGFKLDEKEQFNPDATIYTPLPSHKGIANSSYAINIIRDEGFAVNLDKTHTSFKHQRQEVTGLIVNGDKVHVSQKFKKRFRQEIYYCKKYGVQSHLKHINDHHAFYKEHMYGQAYFINMVEPSLGQELLRLLDSISWEY